MAGGGIGDFLGTLGSGLSGLASQGSGGGGGGGASSGAPDLGTVQPQDVGASVLTNPLVGSEEAVSGQNPALVNQNQQQQQQPVQSPDQPTFTQAPQAQGQMQPVQYLPAGAMDPNQAAQAAVADPNQAAQATVADPNAAQPLTAPVAGGAATAPAAPATDQSGGQTDQQGNQQYGQQKQGGQQGQQNPLTQAGNILKNIAKPHSAPAPSPLANLLNRGPGGLLQDLMGLTNQAGPAYGPQEYGSQGATEHGYGYGAGEPSAQAAAMPPSPPQQPPAPQPPISGAVNAPITPSTAPTAAEDPNQAKQADIQPGSAASAIRAGYDGAGAQENPDGSRVPTDGMPGGTTPKAPPPTPGFGAIPNQAQRPRFYRGKITVNGKQYDFGTGGGQFASLPYGTYHLHPGAIGSIGKRIGAIAGISDSNNAGDNTVHDPLYRGGGGTHARAGVEVHPDVSGGGMRTNGCIGIARNQWGAFSRDFRTAAAQGPLTLTVGPEGASINSAPAATAQRAGGASDLEGIVNTTARLAPGGLPTEGYRRSSNVEDARGNPFMTPLTYPQNDPRGERVIPENLYNQAATDQQQALLRATGSPMSQQLGFNDIDPLLDQIAQQWAMQFMGGQVPMPRPRPQGF